MSLADERASSALKSLIDLRGKVLARDDAWEACSDDQRDVAMSELDSIQNDILKVDFDLPASRLCGLDLLLDGSDQPNFADDFKNSLFEMLRHPPR